MKRFRKISMGIAMVLAFVVGALADDANPYAPVVARNVFGLNPLVADVVPPPQTVEPIVKITPNGIISVFGQVQVLFKVAEKTSREASYIFAEGQGNDGIEVIKIDQETGVITFNNHGLVQKLALRSVSVATGGVPSPQP